MSEYSIGPPWADPDQEERNMKATLEYTLPEERTEFEQAAKAWRISLAIWEYDNWLRSIVKYNETMTDEQIDIYDLCRERLHDIIIENNCTEVFE